MTHTVKFVYMGRIVGNCYIIRTEIGFILIDTGRASKRIRLEKELDTAGCRPGDLNLIILTHGDFDHTGNCAYIRDRFGAKIAMHRDDSGMVEYGDMFCNRKTGGFLIKNVVNLLFRIEKFKPDLMVDDGYDLSKHGFNAKIIHLPGHSKGSIGVLTSSGDLFCGDLFVNTKKPKLNSIIDDSAEANASAEKLRGYDVRMVYPGHGRPFRMNSMNS
jgi:hydroxyacylglutathione hydrolase